MATLAELKKIQADSAKDPVDSEGNPQPADVLAAIALLGKIEVAVWKEAQQRLAGTDPTFPPETPIDEQNRLRNEAIGWAQSAIQFTEAQARTALKLLLATFFALPTAQILGAADADIETAVNSLIPNLSQGFHPGRR
jgi:hypothetical protein